MNKKNFYNLTVKMDTQLKNKLEFVQKQTGLSKSSVIRFAITQMYLSYGGE